PVGSKPSLHGSSWSVNARDWTPTRYVPPGAVRDWEPGEAVTAAARITRAANNLRGDGSTNLILLPYDRPSRPSSVPARNGDCGWHGPWQTRPVRVVVAEDVMLTREGIIRVLTAAGVEVVGESGDVDALMHALTVSRPDCAVVDIRMPPTHTDEGIVAAQRIRELHPEIGVLVLSQYVEPGFAMRLLEENPER